METCLLPNTQSALVQAVVSEQEVQQIPKHGHFGVGLDRGEQFIANPHYLPALSPKMKCGRVSISSSNPLCSGKPSISNCSSHIFSVINNEFVIGGKLY